MSEWNWIDALAKIQANSQAATLCTVSATQGSTPRELGAKMIVFPDGRIEGTIGGGHLELKAIADAQQCLTLGITKKIIYPLAAKVGQCCGGSVEILFECIQPMPDLYIFGAGHVGQAVCETLRHTSFRLHLIDEREEFVLSKAIDASVIRHHIDADSFIDDANWSDQLTFSTVMTHRHDLDEAIIAKLLDKPSRYIGLIGSTAKWNRFQLRYLARGISAEKLSRVKCPIGVGNLGKSPKAVAISLAAELLELQNA